MSEHPRQPGLHTWRPGQEFKVVALAGGVGGARLADGLARALPAGCLTVIVNIGDDFEHYGLKICPDLDTVCYTLAGLENPATGWGQRDESYQVLDTAIALGGPDWFRLGDRDLATHLERTRRLALGEALSQITAGFCQRWEINATVLPASDQPVPTVVLSDQGELAFQEYFVHQHCAPQVRGFRFAGVEQVSPAPGVLKSLAEADVLLICPSNPWVSIDPILAIPGIHQAIIQRTGQLPVVAVSPIIAGKTVKGPAAKMFTELGIQPSAAAVAAHYAPLLSGFVLDCEDEGLPSGLPVSGLAVQYMQTLMTDRAERLRLAAEVLDFAARLTNRPLPVNPSIIQDSSMQQYQQGEC